MALEYHQTMKCIIYKNTDEKTHSKLCTYAFYNICALNPPSMQVMGVAIQNINNLNPTGISHQNGIQLHPGAESSVIPQINPSFAG